MSLKLRWHGGEISGTTQCGLLRKSSRTKERKTKRGGKGLDKAVESEPYLSRYHHFAHTKLPAKTRRKIIFCGYPKLRMSGIEVLGLISSIISVIDASLEIYNAVKDASGLPASFRDVASRLPVIKITIRKAIDEFHTNESDDFYKDMKPSLEMCKEKVEELEGIFRHAMRSSEASRIAKSLNAIRTIRKAERVMLLKTGIMEDLQVLTANQTIRTATRAQVQELSDTVSRGSFIHRGSSFISVRNTGNGRQTIHSGAGDQRTDDGPLFSGVFNGPLYYTRSR